ncbi:hypothetical protein DFR50_104148 [Roseiarcus fermentans]|uniref:Uncharacterized protein n=1 Tax=Roseiarcus fermentans TaxID=1473586 RepID=A0A366FS36_9HYPH|nr:hypothetical protein [Roseiarcus fermentans]RBP16870.1 hypothetical protein DFR50_104148 [Roseiarcus fermentans]
MTQSYLLFTGGDGAGGTSLYITDGVNVRQLADSSTQGSLFQTDPIFGQISTQVVGSTLYLTLADSTGQTSAIWSYDGSRLTQITSSADYVNGATDPNAAGPQSALALFGTQDLVFGQATLASNADGNYDTTTLAVYNTATKTISQPVSPNGGYNPQDFVNLNGVLYYEALDKTTNAEAIYSYNGTSVTEIYNAHPTFVNTAYDPSIVQPAAGAVDGPLVAFNGHLYFSSSQETLYELNALSSLSNNATNVSGSSAYPYNGFGDTDLIVFNNSLYFCNGNNGVYKLGADNALTNLIGSIGAQSFTPVINGGTMDFVSYALVNYQLVPELYQTTGGAPTIAVANYSASDFVAYNGVIYDNLSSTGLADVNGATPGVLAVPGGQGGAPLVVIPFNATGFAGPATVSSVGVPATGDYGVGSVLTFTVGFNEPVDVTGTPRIAIDLATGGVAYANYISGGGTSALTFQYTVAAGQQALAGITTGSAIDVNGGAITDAASDSANLDISAVEPSTSGIVINTFAPTESVAQVLATMSALNALPTGFAVADTAAHIEANLAALSADAAHVTTVTATGGPVTASIAQFTADEPLLDKVVGGFVVADTAANIAAYLTASVPGGPSALALDAGDVASISATGGTVTVGNGVFAADQPALDKIVGGFALSGKASVLNGNLAGLAADQAHIDSVTANGGAITATIAQFQSDQPLLDKVVGGFVVSDTAANIAAYLTASVPGGPSALALDAGHVASISATGGTVTVGNGVFAADQPALDEIVGGFALSGKASVLNGNLDGLEADQAHIDSVTANGGAITATIAQFAADQPLLDKVVGGFVVSDTAANISAYLTASVPGGPSALALDGHVASITASGGAVTVGNGVFAADQPALDKVAGGFAISGKASVLNGNLAGLEADQAHIDSVAANGGAITATIAQFAADQPLLDKVVGGFVVSDTAANIAAYLTASVPGGPSALALDASHIASIAASGGTVTVGNGVLVADQPALDEIAGGFAISGKASVLSGNLDGLQNDVGHILSITGASGVITGTMANFTRDEAAMNKIAGGFNLADTAANIAAGLDLLRGDVGHIDAITLTDATKPTITLTAAQASADAAVLAKITSPYTLVT